MNTNDFAIFISQNSFWIAILIVIGFIIFIFLRFYFDNEKKINKFMKRFKKKTNNNDKEVNQNGMDTTEKEN